MKKNVRQKITFKQFFGELKARQKQYAIFIIILFFLLFLPGQSYYQTLSLEKKEPLFFESPIVLPKPAPYPENSHTESNPTISAEGAILIDVDSQVVMFAKNPETTFLPASTVKIMTAVVSLEKYNPDAVLTAWESISESSSDAALMGLKSGDRVLVKNILYGLLLNSGADAAETLSQNYPGGKKAFIDEMNLKAKSLHLNNTHYTNEIGLDDPNQYTSVLDLARLTTYALKKDLFKKIVGTREVFVSDVLGSKRYYLKNINKLLGLIWGVDGVKTGYTEQAKECLVTSAKRNDRHLLSVVLKSNDRFGESQELLEWGFRNFNWKSY